MSKARPILPGTTYLLTRRCAQRQFWLLPTVLTTQIIVFCLAIAANKFGIRVHAVCAMSNHIHIVLTDMEGRLPDFSHWLFKFIGTVINVSLGRRGSLWEQAEKPSQVRLTDRKSIIEKIAYTIVNPTAAGLVESHKMWPGLCAIFDGKQRHATQRPGIYFSKNGDIPALATLMLSRPPMFDDLTDAELIKLIRKAVHKLERKERRAILNAGRTFMGVKRIMRQKRWHCPSTRETRRKISPRVAGRNKWARIEALVFLKEWYREYCEARDAFIAGNRDVIFPAGTFALRVRRGVNCAPCAAAV